MSHKKPKLAYFFQLVILCLSLLTINNALAKNFNEEGPLIKVKKVIQLDGLNADNIYAGAKKWLANGHLNNPEIIKEVALPRKNVKVIIIKSNFNYPCEDQVGCLAWGASEVRFKLTIEAKDNKARISFTDISLFSPESIIHPGFKGPLINDGFRAKASISKEHMYTLIKDLRSFILKTSANLQ